MHAASNSFTILNRVDSTNNYAMGMIRDGIAKHGDAWFSYDQTHGKGRRGKTWTADKGKNIILSIAVNTSLLDVSRQFFISIAAALGSIDLFKKYAGDETAIKWPNDIFWNDRKAGGILIENSIQGSKWQWSVIGVGININQTEFLLDSIFVPVSLKQITGKEFDVIALAKELQEDIMKKFEEIGKKNKGNILAEYNQNLFMLNRIIKLKKDNAVFETTLVGVNSEGKLKTKDALEREFDFDEVEWRK